MFKKFTAAALILCMALGAGGCKMADAGASAFRWGDPGEPGPHTGPTGRYHADEMGRVLDADHGKPPSPAQAVTQGVKEGAEDIARDAENAARDPAKAARDAAHDITQGAKHAADTVTDAAENAGKAVAKGAEDTMSYSGRGGSAGTQALWPGVNPGQIPQDIQEAARETKNDIENGIGTTGEHAITHR